mgnify:CR=1 FL=1
MKNLKNFLDDRFSTSGKIIMATGIILAIATIIIVNIIFDGAYIIYKV